MKSLIFSFMLLFFCAACHKDNSVIRVAATPIPHAEMLEFIKPELKKRGVTLEVVEIDDYNLPNRLLEEGRVDANFFQHEPFLKAQEKEFGYDFVILKQIHFEPLGIYSSKLTSLNMLQTGSTIAIPSDPSNEARALQLLEREGIIGLKNPQDPLATLLDIASNPKRIRFQEVDAAFLPRILPDVDLAIIPGNFALQGNLSPSQALAKEPSCSPYANLLITLKGSETRPELILIGDLLSSKEMQAFLNEKFKGALEIVKCPTSAQ